MSSHDDDARPRVLWRRRVAAVFLGLVATLVVLELALRVSNAVPEVANPLYSFHESNARTGWRGKPNVRQRFHRPDFDVLIEHDEAGWRRKDPPAPANAPHSVLFLGDSFTWGWGVGRGEVFTDLLQAAVGARVEIVNRGVNAFGTAQELLLLRDELAARHFDRVVVVMCGNDLEDNLDPKSGRRPGWKLEAGALVPTHQPPLQLMSPVKQFIGDHSRAVLFLGFMSNRLFSGWGRDEVVAWSLDPATATQAEDLALRLFGEIDSGVRAQGGDWLVVPVPIPDVAHPGRFTHGKDMERFLARLSGESGVRVVSLVDGANAKAAAGVQIKFAHDNHWTPAGHRATAEALLAAGVCTWP